MSNAELLFINLYKEIINFYNSAAFSVIKFIIGIYVVVIFLDIILLLLQRGLGEDIRITLFGTEIPRELIPGKNKIINEWMRLKGDLESGDENKYKLAIIKADAIIENLLDKLNYKGRNFSEKVASIPEGHLEHVEDIKQAHEVSNRIVHDENFKIDKKLAQETLSLYENFLDFFGISN